MAVSYDSAVNQQGWKKAKQNEQNKKYISKEKHKFSFIINVYRKTICSRSWGCQR